ncbi:hypothetical protein K438DRAFT_1788872 [Mycena galopus ATCC 62051]|nr:hypothetical protein K438DRAFT_1788872 [Mycena galopus ATCC 62051]
MYVLLHVNGINLEIFQPPPSSRPMFSSFAVEGFCPIFADTVQDVWEKALKSRQRGMVVDIQHWMNSVVLDSLGIVGFGHNFASLKGDYAPSPLHSTRSELRRQTLYRTSSSDSHRYPHPQKHPDCQESHHKGFPGLYRWCRKDVLERNASKGVVKTSLSSAFKSLAENPAGEFRLSHAEVTAQIGSRPLLLASAYVAILTHQTVG